MRKIYPFVYSLILMLIALCCIPHYPLGISSDVYHLVYVPPQYETWFNEMAQCTFTFIYKHPFADIEWYISERLWNTEDEHNIAGFFKSPNIIYLASPWQMDEHIVKHEIGHYLGFSHDDDILYTCSGTVRP